MQVSLDPNVEDSILWPASPSHQYSASSAYQLFFMAKTKSASGSKIWKAGAPSRCKFFMWLAVQGRCLTMDNLLKRGWPHQSCCVLCSAEPETCLHLFAGCSYTGWIWSRLQAWLNIPFATPAADEQDAVAWWYAARKLFLKKLCQANCYGGLKRSCDLSGQHGTSKKNPTCSFSERLDL